ncbi:MAG: MATE family efflux transporter, partial [Oscillospiraceae bacterium]
IQALVNAQGPDFMAGFNGANKIDTLGFLPIQSFATAVTTYAGQNIGAMKYDRVKKGAISGVIMSVIVSLVLAIIMVPTAPYLMQLFNNNPAVIDAGVQYLIRIMPFYSLLSVLFILNGVMRGAGDMIIPMISSLIGLWIARVPAAYLLNHFFGAENMFFCYAIGWILGLAVTVPFFLLGKWKNKRVL